MYNVEVVEHFEDWFWFSTTVGEFNTLDKAILSFTEEYQALLHNKFSSDGIDGCISENFSDEMDEMNDEEWSKGFIVAICCNEQTIVSQHFNYDHRTQSIIGNYNIELNLEDLSTLDASEILSMITPDSAS